VARRGREHWDGSARQPTLPADLNGRTDRAATESEPC
jgi:hypothetical protein